MQLGEQVNGLMMDPEWRFVTADAHDVHLAVNRHDSKARLVGTPRGRIGVARFIERAKLEEDFEAMTGIAADDAGGAWMLVFHPKRDGAPMVGEPDASVITQLQERDLWARRSGVNERDLLDQFEQMQRLQEERTQAAQREHMRAIAEQQLFGWARQHKLTWKPRIFVPGRG